MKCVEQLNKKYYTHSSVSHQIPPERAKSFPLVTTAAHRTPIPLWEVNHCGGTAVHRPAASPPGRPTAGAGLHLGSRPSETWALNAAYSWSLLCSTQVTITISTSTLHSLLSYKKNRKGSGLEGKKKSRKVFGMIFFIKEMKTRRWCIS